MRRKSKYAYGKVGESMEGLGRLRDAEADELPVLDPNVFRRCKGWKDAGGETRFSDEHQPYFLIPHMEKLQGERAGKRERCLYCARDRHKYQTKCRIRKHHTSKTTRLRVDWYRGLIERYKAGELKLSPAMLNECKKNIFEHGGLISDLGV